MRPKPKALKKAGLVDVDAVTEVWEAALAAPAWEKPPVWIHGDLEAGNLLARNGRLSAVIDFGTPAVAQPRRGPYARLEVPARAGTGRLPRGGRRRRRDLGAGPRLGLAGSLPVPDDPFFRDHPARATAALKHLEAILAVHRSNGA